MGSGLVDGIEVRGVSGPNPLNRAVAKAHTEGHGQTWRRINTGMWPFCPQGAMMAAEMVAADQARSAFAFTGTAGHHR